MKVRKTISLTKTATGQPLEAVLYGPEKGGSRAAIAVIHGMSEHSARYLDFARHMTARGCSVLLFDLPGHGRIAQAEGLLGFFAAKDGGRCVKNDLAKLLTEVKAKLLPEELFILFGHSMGSMLARLLSTNQQLAFDAVILSGVTAKNKAAVLAAHIASILASIRGPKYVSGFFGKLSQKDYLSRYSDVRSKNDWLSRDRDVVTAYDADPLCGFPFTVSGWRDLLGWMKEIDQQDIYRRMEKNIPYFVFSGENDPVGGFGKGVDEFVTLLKNAGHDVTYKLYDGGRHEMLNEINREEVLADLTTFLDRVSLSEVK